ncbi:unnamed protein product [Heligmosomoides polygyrus]|uniref:Recombinase RecX n=1 Tax=Heligmosomoides polygyrus TaxID=6339 RepID=A0A183GV41_HELPZ|nr:unnamed protein product [Heligmosomoides polygyrus]
MIDDDAIIAMLEFLMFWILNEEKTYISEDHVSYLETRFRLFDEYLCSHNPTSFFKFIRLYPDEFETLHNRLRPRLDHAITHLAPIHSKHRL